jgi:hypothetical protein
MSEESLRFCSTFDIVDAGFRFASLLLGLLLLLLVLLLL